MLRPRGTGKSQSARGSQCLALPVFLFLTVSWGREAECPRPVQDGAQECHLGQKACQREGEGKSLHQKSWSLSWLRSALQGPRKSAL